MSTIEQQVTDAFNGKGWPAGKDGPSMLLDAAAELRRVRQELSLAEEGLANYAQENAALSDAMAAANTEAVRLRAALEWCEGEAEKGEATCWHCSQVAWKTAEALPESPEPQTCRIDSVSGNAYSAPNGKDESGTAPGAARETREAGPKEV